MKNPEYIMLHHSAVSRFSNPDQFNANNRYHKAKWNFISSLGYYLGYNYEIAASGKIRKARKNGEVTAACYQQGMNDGRCVHICIDGNFQIEKPTANQIQSIRELIVRLVAKYEISKQNIVTHQEYSSTACPGSYIISQLDFIRNMVDQEKPEEINEDELKFGILDLFWQLLNKIKILINK